MLPSAREALLACPPFPLWNLPSFMVESTLLTPHALALIPFSLAHLDFFPPHDLVLWTDGSLAFPFGRGGSGVLANCSPALRPLFPFQQAQYVQVFLLKLAPFCTLFSGFGSTNKSATCLLLCDSRFVLATLSSPFFLLSQTLWQIWQEPSFSLLLYHATMGPRTLVSPGKRRG